jgi:hypothetical protein
MQMSQRESEDFVEEELKVKGPLNSHTKNRKDSMQDKNKETGDPEVFVEKQRKKKKPELLNFKNETLKNDLSKGI